MFQRTRTKNPRIQRVYKNFNVHPIFNTFEAFYAVMGDMPEGKSLDRYPDKDGDYAPGNLRWATAKEHGENRNGVHMVTYNGKTQTIHDWSTETGIKRDTLWARIIRRKWPLEKALTVGRYGHRNPNPTKGKPRAKRGEPNSRWK